MTRWRSCRSCRTLSSPASQGTSTLSRSWRCWGAHQTLSSAEEIAALSQCLEDETLLRLFLTGVIGQTGPLSAESSTCVRSGFANFDLRSVMFATPAESEEEAAMVGGMGGLPSDAFLPERRGMAGCRSLLGHGR